MDVELTESQKKIRVALVSAIFTFFVIFLLGMIWLSTNPASTVTYTLAFAAGLSMIVLPCTLPLVFVIVPLSMGQGYKKGVLMAILFGIGLIITLSIYGVVIALGGQALSLNRMILYIFVGAGIFAFIFGLSELKLLKVTLPTYGKTPRFIQQQGDYLRVFLLGLFLGNAGMGCPNPATYVILAYIAAQGKVLYGIGLQAINGVGRVIPLLAFAFLAILGVNSISWLVKRRELISRITGWGLVFFGAIIIVWGLYGHFWFLNTPIHEGWDAVFSRVSAGTGEYNCCVEPPCESCRTDGMFPNRSCQCRFHYRRYLDLKAEGKTAQASKHYERWVCDECKAALSEGQGVIEMAERSQYPAFGILSTLTLGPILWYLGVRRKKEKSEEKQV